MNKSVFNGLIVPKINFLKTDRAMVSFSEIKVIDRNKVIVTYIWKNKQLVLINVLSKKEYISKNEVSGKTTTRGTIAKHILGKEDWNYIGYDITCKNNNKNDFICALDKEIGFYKNGNLFETVERYIKKLNSVQTEFLRQRRKKIEDQYFNQFKTPKFPKGFFEFCEKWIEKNDKMFISKNRRNGYYKGYCSHCGYKFSTTDYNYAGQLLTCPYCWEKIEFRFDHKDDTRIMFVANIGYFEKIKGEVAIRLFHIYRRKCDEGYNELKETDFKEYARYVITDKKVYYWQCEYRYGMGNHWDECQWYSTAFRVFDRYFALYNNLGSLNLRTPLLKFTEIIEKQAHCDTQIFKILFAYKKYPSIEYLQAQGWKNIVIDIINGDHLGTLNPKGASATEVFGIDVNKVKKYGQGIDALQLFIIKLADQMKLSIDAEALRYLAKSYDKKRQAILIAKLFKYIKPIKFAHYAKAQKIFIGDYSDYLDQLQKLNYDMQSEINLYPRDFGKAHTEMSALITAHQKKIFETAVQTIYEKYHQLCEWEKDGFMILMAKNCKEIIAEGATQNHCVGNYCERVAKCESIILFLRRSELPDNAFYTMEIRPDMRKLNIIQCRGYGNQDPPAEVRAEVDGFLGKYEKWFNRRSTAEVKNEIVSKYYKAVRKTIDGCYISAYDGRTEYKIGEICEAEVDKNPDNVAVKGLHIASLEFAQNYGNGWKDVAILEVEVNLNDVIVPDAKDQIRTSRFKVLREVPMSEMGEWGDRHMTKPKKKADHAA